MRGGPAREPRVGLHVVGAVGPGLPQHQTQEAVCPGNRSDRLPLLVAHTRGVELRESALLVRDAQGGELRPDEASRRLHDHLQDLAGRGLLRHREQGPGEGVEIVPAVGRHG